MKTFALLITASAMFAAQVADLKAQTATGTGNANSNSESVPELMTLARCGG